MIYTSEQDPLIALANAKVPGTLAIITHIEGPSYRSLGATMAILDGGSSVGTLSSGCIEADLIHHAQTAVELGKPVTIRYGQGSQFIDIQLPCGGTLDVTLIHNPDKVILVELISQLKQRLACHLLVDLETGGLSLNRDEIDKSIGRHFSTRMLPQLRFLVFGKGPEASTFVSLTHIASFPSLFLTPDANMCLQAEKIGCPNRQLKMPEFPKDIFIDEWTAVVLFFHDHDWEPPILKTALASPAFYVGAQGSKRANQNLLHELDAIGVSEQQAKKLMGPIGLIPSTRDSRTLAVSVLAEILSMSK